MPPRVRDLIAELEAAGFENRGGKGSHRNYVHPRLSKPITIPANLGMTPSDTRYALLERRSRSLKNEG